ncbi:MAG: NAD(P)/FAD-dependent oxidoreductase [Burkholderiales bacterium]
MLVHTRTGSRIAVVGSGISGLAAARLLSRGHAVSLFEAAPRLGGHANTLDVVLDGIAHPVDTGFLVYNRATYPNLVRLFDELGVPAAPSEMSFSVSLDSPAIEWAGTDLGTLFAQPANLLRPGFIRMLRDVLRFNHEAPRAHGAPTLGAFLAAGRYSAEFRDWYLLPMAAAIWSCPTRAMLDYPFEAFARFFRNHGLLQLADRPQWYTVPGGSRRYVEAIARELADVRVSTPVRTLQREAGGVRVNGERFDAVVLACHSDQALRLLGAGATHAERAVLGAIPYRRNRALLHTDASLLPRRRRVWSAWNYSAGRATPEGRPVAVHYLLNKLQPLPFARPVIVSLNPHREPAAGSVLAEIDYEHPVFGAGADAAQARLAAIQGTRRTWFCGAWTRNGFHEDGLASAIAVADSLRLESLREAA